MHNNAQLNHAKLPQELLDDMTPTPFRRQVEKAINSTSELRH